MKISRIKSVVLNDEECPLGVVFTLVCGSETDDQYDVEYTLIALKKFQIKS